MWQNKVQNIKCVLDETVLGLWSETSLINRVCCFSTAADITSTFNTFERLHTDFYDVLNITLEPQWTR